MKKYTFELKAKELKPQPNKRVQDNLNLFAYHIENSTHNNHRNCDVSWFDNTPKNSRSTVTRILRKRGFKVIPVQKEKMVSIFW